ncbi:hypothetical protein LB523_11835 [Mesorhizobium sp. ESP-6-4]|uniref:hypothetical protein n=1 Tax=Mesorhizobium sp. ESP-6-4 TaxID=2876624 RepID=UPI001CCC7C6A|nr:hypothetical protein [Mesorhizobium sp. ESP-6-4]MBZ9659735.1 hypothetical protein [Mesorhizobium sp. ESP-6-4]
MIAKHTPTPWVFSPGRHTHDCIIHAADADDSEYGYILPDKGGVVGSSEWIWLSDEDGEFIVRAVNAHDALVAALEMARASIAGEWGEDHPEVKEIDAALARARKGG